MYNRNLNGIITVSPKIESITDTAIKQNEFGISITELVTLANKAYVSPVLRFPSTTKGKFVEYTMTAFRNVENGYEFKFVSDTNVLTLTANTSTKKYSLTFTPFIFVVPNELHLVNVTDYTFDIVYDHETTETLELTNAILSDFMQNGKVIGITKDEMFEGEGNSYHGLITGYSIYGNNLVCTFTAKTDNLIYSVYATIFDYADAEARTILLRGQIDTFPNGDVQYAQALPFYDLDFPYTYTNSDLETNVSAFATCNILRNIVDGFKERNNVDNFFYGLTDDGKQYTLNTISETDGTATVTFSRCDASGAETLTFVITDYESMTLRTLTTSITTKTFT